MTRRMQGWSLIEAAIVLALLGGLTVMAVGFLAASNQRAETMRMTQQMDAADRAVAGFVMAWNRLPCPDADRDGYEDCASSDPGYLPWKTLGVPSQDLRETRYALFRHTGASAWEDADLAAGSRDRLRLPRTQGDPLVGAEMLLGNATALDFCHAVQNGRRLPADGARLHVMDGGDMFPVAYVLAHPGGDGVFEGRNASLSEAFESPSRGLSFDYDDRVLAVGFDALWSRMGCSEPVAAVRSHANVAVSASMLATSMADYKAQLDLAAQKAAAAVASATASQFSAAAGLANATASSAVAIAQAILSYGAMGPVIAAAVAAIVANTAATVTAAATLATAIAGAAIAGTTAAKAGGLVSASASLATDIRDNADAADARIIHE